MPEDNDLDRIYRHYTNYRGILGIGSTGTIQANSKGLVYITQGLYSSVQTLSALFAGDKSYSDRGEYMIEFALADGAPCYGVNQVPEATQPNETVCYGSLSLGREIQYFTYVGKNPF